MPITKTINFLPAVFQSETNKKFLNATLDQLVTEPNLIPINGYVGRKFAPGFKGIGTYVKEATTDRADYQLEPSIIVKNPTSGDVEFNTTYPEILQKIEYYGGKIDNQNNLWASEFYSYNPRINADAFVNYGQYYWLPNGPDAVDVFSGTVDTTRTFYVYPNNGINVYNISGYNTAPNPDLVLARGGSYTFKIDQLGKKFWIQTAPGVNGTSTRTNQSIREVLGVVNNGTDKGTVTFNVPLATAQDFYVSMPVLQDIDLVSAQTYADLQGKLLSEILQTYNGIDGQRSNLNGKYVIFGNYSANAADWTYNSTVVPESKRYGIWQIVLTPTVNNDYIFNLAFYLPIPLNHKVVAMSGIEYGNTEWYTNADAKLVRIPVITAPLNVFYYQDGTDPEQYGTIKIVEQGSSSINVTTEILGKTEYISPNGITFTNGLKIVFDSQVTPDSYKNSEFYVEGVGTSIQLVPVSALVVNKTQSLAAYDPTIGFVECASANLNLAKDQLSVTTTDFPVGTNIAVGTFPNIDNANPIVESQELIKYPYRAGQDVPGSHDSILFYTDVIGVTLPGILINGISNGGYINGDNNTTWHYDVNQVLVNGQDAYGGQTLGTGNYVYTSGKFISGNAWGNVHGFTDGYTSSTGHSKLIGFAADGYPIYGPYGYSNPVVASSPVTKMVSSYIATNTGLYRPVAQTVNVVVAVANSRYVTVDTTFGLNPGMRVTVNSAGLVNGSYWIVDNGLKTVNGLGSSDIQARQIKLNKEVTISAGSTLTFEFLPGAFIEDYSYSQDSGTLDQYNGRFCVTPDFPDGTYAYFTTETAAGEPVYPYFVGPSYYGSLSVDTNTSLSEPDYIVINRASRDLNPWTRRNRWFHKSIVELTAAYNNTPQVFDAELRAKRPIIEFDADLQLINFGKTAKQPVDLFDTSYTTPFLTIEGQPAASADGVNLVEGMRIVFSADQDSTTRGKIWVVNFVNVTTANPNGPRIIHLTLASDGNVTAHDTVSVFNGESNNGKCFWYDGLSWIDGQQKTSLNQAPLFDVFDIDGVSFGDITKYPVNNSDTTFNGTKIFSYKLGTGTADSVLGFPLAYKNFNNIGDIQFDNNFDTEYFQYGADGTVYTKKINAGFLYKNSASGTVTELNVWTNVINQSRQMQDLAFTYDGINNNFTIDINPAVASVEPNLLVYVNAKKLATAYYQLYNLPGNNRLITIDKTKLSADDRVDVLVFSGEVSNIGFYQIPDNLNLNSQNKVLESPTLGEMRNHIGHLAESNLFFKGSFPGVSNARDLHISNLPGVMLQQSAPVPYAGLFLNSDKYNFVDSVALAQREYTRFKNKFLTLASVSSMVNPRNPSASVDYIIQQINQVKDNTFPWYYSDMVPYGDDKNVISYTIFDPRQTNYEITSIFSLSSVSNKAILVYINGSQLTYGIDYSFLTTGPGIVLSPTLTLNVGDKLVINEYNSTDANWIPETPTKLGLYPKFTPTIYIDRTYTEPQKMIRGHDGSLTPSFGDFRDTLLLDLEKRIYNNIKVEYSDKMVNIYDTIPGKFRDNGYSISEYNILLSRMYLPWVGTNNLNYVTNDTFDATKPLTYNYGSSLDVINGEKLPGSWRACYEYYYDTQHPHLYPWEMLGFSEEPTWWKDTYGPAPYTSGNKILWGDLEAGRIVAGERAGIDARFARPGLSNIIPVNENGQLLPPIGLLTTKYDPQSFGKNWTIGNFSPTETAWRNSSEYPFAMQYIAAMVRPGKYFAYGIQTSKYRYNTGLQQYVVTGTNNRLSQSDITVNGYVSSTGAVSRAAGYLNWVADYQVSQGITDKTDLLNFVQNFNVQLSYRMASYTGKQYLKVLAEQNSPNSKNETIIVPDSDYDLILNKSTPVLNARYSAIIIEKTSTGFRIDGYDTNHPYVTIVPPMPTGESHVIKVLDNTVNYFTEYSNYKLSIPYGTELTSIQQVANLLSGYERYLRSQGFMFNDFDDTLGQIRNWELSTREFLFWTQQGWPNGGTIVLGPCANTVKLVNGSATVDTIYGSFNGSKIMNQSFQVLSSDSYTVARDNNQVTISLVNSKDLISFVELNLVQYEHVLAFNNKTQFNDIIYDPVMGQRQYRLKLVGNKTGGWTGTFSAQGFVYNQPKVASWTANKDYLKGDLVEYKNFYYAASKDLPGTADFSFSVWLPVNKNNVKTGLLNNFARNAQIGETFYDTNNVNLESEFDKYALGLIGYRNRTYLNDLGLDDVTQVKFYQGFIKEKGTLNSINALGHVAFNDRASDVLVSEDWAFRVGAYGSLETNQSIDLVLPEVSIINNPTSIEVVDGTSVVYNSLTSSTNGVFKTSVVPWKPPFLLNRTADSDFSDDIQTAGFVNIEDVEYTVFDLTDISTLNTDISNIGASSVVWTAKNYSQSWDVYRVSESTTRVNRITNALNGKISINTNVSHGLLEGDTILIKNVGDFNGFYKVEVVSGLTSFIVSYAGTLAGFSFKTYDGPIHKLSSMKVERPVDINGITPASGWQPKDKVWVNSANTNKEWAVYNKTEPWTLTKSLPKGSLAPGSQFGSAVKLSYDNNFALSAAPGATAIYGYVPLTRANVGSITNYVVNFSNQLVEDITITTSANNAVGLGTTLDSGKNYAVAGAPASANNSGYVYVYYREITGSIAETQLMVGNIQSAARYGESIALSQDDQWLYIGAPGEDKVYVYGFNHTIPEEKYTISANGTANAFVLSFAPVSTNTILVRSSTRTYVPGIDFTVNSSTITFAVAPVESKIVVTQNPCFTLYTTITGNANSAFGSSLATTTDGAQVVIGAPHANVTIDSGTYTQTGSISTWDRSVNSYLADTNQTLFGGVNLIDSFTKVYVDGTEVYKGTDWVTFALNTVQFLTPPGQSKIITIETNVFRKIEESYSSTPYNGQQFGYSVDLCNNNCSIYVGAPYSSSVNLYNGAVYRLLNQGKVYGTIVGTPNPVIASGSSIRINNFEVAFVTSSLADAVDAINAKRIPGVSASIENNSLKLVSNSVVTADKLRILPGVGNALDALGLNVFVEVDKIHNPSTKSYDYFGKKVKVNSKSNILVVGSDQATTLEQTVFDASVQATTFDATSTRFLEPVNESGAVWIYSYLGDNRSTIEYPGKFTFIQQLTPTVTGSGLKSSDGFGSDISITDYELIIGAKNNKTLNFNSGKVYQFNNFDKLLGWDAYRNQEPRVDLNSIIKSYVYSDASQTIKYNLDYIDPAKGKILGLAEQEITYKIDYDPAVYNNSSLTDVTLNSSLYWSDQQVGQVWWDLSKVRYMLYEQGTIGYRSTNWGRAFPGSSIDVYEWVESLYPPSQYVANGGDGVPKYADNGAYVTLTYIDPLTNYATVKYYFWVKDKTTLTTTNSERTIPTVTIASYISDPKNSGVKFFAPLRNDSVSIYNMVGETTGSDTIMHIDYATLLNSNIIHSEYALLSDKNSNSAAIPQNIYNKLVDSVSGSDKFGNPVPDPTLPVQSRYGIDIRPRQGMFVDSTQAVKEMLSYVNAVFRTNVISEGYDLSGLYVGEEIPTATSGKYDLVVDNLEELSFVNIYILPVGFKILVKNDSSVGNLWTIYIKDVASYNWTANTSYIKGDVILYNGRSFSAIDDFTSGPVFNTTYLQEYIVQDKWVLIKVQSYNTADYWNFADWYSADFDKSTRPTYIVDTTADLSRLPLKSGDTIKVRDNGRGKWFIIQVYPNLVNTVAIQDGTIQLSDSLYDLSTAGMGFDTGPFDSTRFDQNPSIEIRQIIETLRNSIFINQLDASFLDLFFVFVNYILDEQKYVDWVFKTSFITVMQKIKGFAQPAIYVKENQDFFKQYIEEVKPYKTTLREYVLDYENNDNYNGYVSDFDVPSIYDSILKTYRSPSGEFINDAIALQQPQYQDWLYNYTYTIESIDVVLGGTGYITAPNITITGSTIGNDAVAKAFVTNGVVTKIEVIYAGSNYITTPVITIESSTGTGAKARANVGNNLIRNIKTTLAYNRYTYDTSVIDWAPGIAFKQGDIIAYNGVAYIVNQAFTSTAIFSATYLTVYPVEKLLTANDRIQAYYQPEIGQPGKDFSLLQAGINYPGVSVDGPTFSETGGFDVASFDSAPFDPLEIDSDGTYVISSSLLDTTITSDFTDTSLGTKPEDIIVDGGAFVYDHYREWAPSTFYDKGDLVSNNNTVYYAVNAFTSSSTFSSENLTTYSMGPYASHGPEELVTGRVFDTLDMKIYTLATDPTSVSFTNWQRTEGIVVGQISVIDGGSGYDPSTTSVILSGGAYYTSATAQAVIGANGSITSIEVINHGAGYFETPTVHVVGPNTSPVVTGITMQLSSLSYASMAYRIFKDMNDGYSYVRVSGSAEAILTSNLTYNSTEIHVDNAQLLPQPSPNGDPGIVFINGERIVYYSKDNTTNTLGQLRRGTAGTAIINHYVGDKVLDGGQSQHVLESGNYTWTPNVADPGVTTRYTGNVTVSSTSNVITGSGSLFNVEFKTGTSIYTNSGDFIGNIDHVISNVSATLTSNSAITTANTSIVSLYTFQAGNEYIRTNLWYTPDSYALIDDAGVTLDILTESGNPTNGLGLFNANTIQVAFLKQGLIQ